MEHRHHGGGTPPGLHHTIFSLSVLPACPVLGCDCPPHRELFYVWPLKVCRSAILRTLQKVQRVGPQTRVLQVRNNELSDLEGFEMGPGQDIPAAIKTLAVSAPKIERGSARRIGHQDMVSVQSIALFFGELRFLARIDALLQYLSQSVAIAFAYGKCRVPP